MIWYQGETDTTDLGLVRTWPEKFGRLVAAIREDLDQPNLPVAMTVIGPTRAPPRFRFWDELAALQLAMELPANVFRVSARDLCGLPDDPHLTAADYLELGRRYAEAFDHVLDDAPSRVGLGTASIDRRDSEAGVN